MVKTTQSANNLLSSRVGNAKGGTVGGSGNHEDKTVKRLPLTSKNLNGATGYLIPNAK